MKIKKKDYKKKAHEIYQNPHRKKKKEIINMVTNGVKIS